MGTCGYRAARSLFHEDRRGSLALRPFVKLFAPPAQRRVARDVLLGEDRSLDEYLVAPNPCIFLKKLDGVVGKGPQRGGHDIGRRSEEHTSELQSLMRISYAVFCLKKKKQR